MERKIVFSQFTPVSNVYEFGVDKVGHAVPKKGKNMENVKDDFIADEQALPTLDTELDATLAIPSDENGEPVIFSQDAEDIDPTVEELSASQKVRV